MRCKALVGADGGRHLPSKHGQCAVNAFPVFLSVGLRQIDARLYPLLSVATAFPARRATLNQNSDLARPRSRAQRNFRARFCVLALSRFFPIGFQIGSAKDSTAPLPARRQRHQCRSKPTESTHSERSASSHTIPPANTAAKRAGALPVTGCCQHCAAHHKHFSRQM